MKYLAHKCHAHAQSDADGGSTKNNMSPSPLVEVIKIGQGVLVSEHLKYIEHFNPLIHRIFLEHNTIFYFRQH